MAGDTAGFESYLRGSWWDVEIKEQRLSMFLVCYKADKDEEWAWVPLTELRLSSRRGDGWDCYILKKGMDISVLSKHPHSNSLNLQKEGLYDARISSVVTCFHAPGECSCRFSLHFYSVKVNTYTDGSLLDRFLLTDEPETQVSISDVRILQKPAENIPLQDVLYAHRVQMWIPLGRACTDAYFVTETELSTTKRPRDHIGPAHVRSPSEVWSPSAAKIGEKESNCNSPVGGPELEISDPGTAEDEYRIPKSLSGAADDQKQQQWAGHADGTSPQSINIKRSCVSAQDHHDDDQSNGIVNEEAPKKRRGRPRREEMPDKPGTRVDEKDDQSNGMVDEAAPKKKHRHARKEMPDKTSKGGTMIPGTGMQIMEGEKLCHKPDVTSTPGLNKGLGKKPQQGYTLQDKGEPEWTETVNVSSDEESLSEWKPWPYLRHMPSRMSYNIRTRDKIILRKPKTEAERQMTGKDTGPPLRRATRSSLYGNRYLFSKDRQGQQQGKSDYCAYNHRNPSGEVLSLESD